MSNNEIVRVLRILEYTGPRGAVERQIKRSIHGEKVIRGNSDPITIRAATIGEFPEVLMRDEPVDEPVAPTDAKPIPAHSEFAPSPIEVYDINVAKSLSVDGARSWNSAPASTPDDEVPF